MNHSKLMAIAAGVALATVAQAGSFDTWACRSRLTIPGYTRAEALTNFPILVSLSTNGVAGFLYEQFAGGTNDDLRFTDDSGTNELNYEIDVWNTGGVSLVWVQVPQVTSNTAVWAYWGKSGQTAPACRTNGTTWSQNYVGVWHMNEVNPRDASGNGNDGTAQSVGVTTSAGRIGNASALAGGTNDWILVSNSTSLGMTQALTLEAWVYNTANDAQARGIMSKRVAGSGEAYYLFKHTGSKIYGNIGGDRDNSQTALTTNTWRQVAMTFDSTLASNLRKKFYFEGMADGVTTDANSSIPVTTANVHLGILEPSYAYRWTGKLDELRISSVARSTNWIWAGWMTAASNTAFQSYGSTVLTTPSAATLAPGSIMPTTAALNGQLVSTGTLDSALFVYWGLADAGTNSGTWGNSGLWGAPQSAGLFTTNVTGLTADRTYYYRFAASNAAGVVWAGTSTNFVTSGVWVDAFGTAAENGLGAGTFTVHRASTATNEPLTVNYAVSGTASNGADYAALNGWVTFAAGASATNVVVVPLFDKNPTEGTEAVTLTLLPGTYAIGSPSNATLNLTDNTGVGYVYVWTNSPAEAAPYTTWDSASHDIQKAITYCSTNLATYDTVVVTNGAYSVSSQPLLITNGVSLRGANGSAATVLFRLGSGATTNVLTVTTASTGTVVDGFTITNGTVGGVYLGAGILQNSDIAFNSAKNAGGVDVAGSATVRVCRIYGNSVNTSGAAGGGVRLSAANAALEDCVVSNNANYMNNGKAGGVSMSAGTVRRCVIANNSSANTAGGASVSGGTMRNCLVRGNWSTGSGGGLLVDGASAVVEHCTVIQNTNTLVTSFGGGVRLTSNGGTVRNCIIQDNWDFGRSSSENVSLAAGTCTYSCSTPLVSGTGNIDAAPGFLNPATGDYHLRLGSPCIDAGMTLPGVTDDLEGTVRPQDGNGDAAAAYDMGAYEVAAVTQGALRCGFYAPTNSGVGSLDVVFTAWAAGTNVSGLSYQWDFDTNGVVDAAGPGKAVVTNTYAVGRYGVRLVVTNAAGETAMAETAGYVYVAPSFIYVAPSGTPAWPYGSWATAATNFDDAMSAAVVGSATSSVILVTNASYALSQQLTVARNLTLRSVGGLPTLWRSPSAGYVASLQASGAVVDGFILTNGASGGVALMAGTLRNSRVERNTNFGVSLTGGVLEDSVVRLNAGRNGGGVDVATAGAIVRRCTIERNSGTYSDGSAKGVGLRMVVAGLVESCIVRSNSNGAITANTGGGAGARLQAGTMRNCLVVGNSYPATTGKAYGGGVWLDGGGALENCTIADNAVGTSGGGVYMTGGSATNCIVFYNACTPDNPQSNNVGRTAGAFEYSCSTPLEAGTSNLVAAPSFINRPGGDYHLALGSPGTDAGAVLAAVTNDVEGVARPQGAGYDMGAYEYSASGPGPLDCNFSGAPLEDVGSLNVAFSGSASGGSDTNYYYAWDFENDGNVDAGGWGSNLVAHTYGPGLWTVALVVSNLAGDVTNKVQGGYVYVAPLVIYVATNGGNVFPYGSWAAAALDVQSAVDAARVSLTTNSSVIVSNGTYLVSNAVTITKAIPVRSVNGASFTLLARGTGTCAVAALNSAGAVLDGFTLTNGNSGGVTIGAGLLRNAVVRNNTGGGVVMTGGSVEDCEIAFNAGRSTLALDMNGAATVARRCRIYANTGSSGGAGTGAGVGIGSSGGSLESCYVINNTNTGNTCAGLAFGGPGTVRNSLIAGNVAGDAAGVRFSGTGARLESCTVAGNITSGTGGGLYGIGTGGTVTNCIVYSNRTNLGVADNITTGGVDRCAYSCAPELTNGLNSNISAEPQFVFPAGGDYRLRAGSPVVGHGFNQAWMTNATDLGGRARIMGTTVDMGCYESDGIAGSVFVIQ